MNQNIVQLKGWVDNYLILRYAQTFRLSNFALKDSFLPKLTVFPTVF